MSDPHAGWEGEAAHAEKGSTLLLIGIILGVVFGVLLGGYAPAFGLRVKILGDLFLHALMMMVIPLVMASMVMGIAALGDVRKLGGIGGKTVIYYTLTTGIAVAIGIVAVNIVQPGRGVTTGETVEGARWTATADAIELEAGALRKLDYDDRFRVEVSVPGPDGADEVLHATIVRPKGERPTPTRLHVEGWRTAAGQPVAPPRAGAGLTVRPAPKKTIEKKEIGEVLEDVLIGMVPTNLIAAAAETQVLPIILFALAFGAVLTTLGKRGEPVIRFFDGTNEAIMKMVQGLMYVAPIGIFALVAGRLGVLGGFEGFWPELKQLGRYAFTVVAGLAVHAVIVLPLILVVFGRRNPLAYARGMATALLTAFSTSSSAATLPLTLRAVEKNGVSERSASFVCPLGATINMDGTAMYEAVAAIFIAQAYGIELDAVKQVVIFLTATLAAIGAAGIPEAGLVTMVIVLNAVGLPPEGIALILMIDWLLDRCRTTVNVWGDAVGAAVIDRLTGGAPGGGGVAIETFGARGGEQRA